jgi:hypothetical protein
MINAADGGIDRRCQLGGARQVVEGGRVCDRPQKRIVMCSVEGPLIFPLCQVRMGSADQSAQ